MKFNRLFKMFIISMLLVMITACSNNAADDEKATEPKTEARDLILATTTSTQDSGLLDELIPMFEKQNEGVNVKVIAVGTGEALEMGKKGEADALLVHAPKAEEEVVASGDATNRKRVMYNDFLIAGPKSDPAKVKGMEVKAAFKKIQVSNAVFVSRGDDSGTHKKEVDVWKAAGVDPKQNKSYESTGQGMGATLQVAAEKQGYVLTDRATYLAQKKNMKDMEILVEGDKDLLNIYHVMQVNPGKHEKVNSEDAKKFVDFMVAEDTLNVIKEFGQKEYGESLFTPYTE